MKGCVASAAQSSLTSRFILVLLSGLAATAIAQAQEPAQAEGSSVFTPLNASTGSASGQAASVTEPILVALNRTDSGLEPRVGQCYAPPTHLIPRAHLSFSLPPEGVTVTSALTITPNPEWAEWLVETAPDQEGCNNNPWSYLSGATQDEAAANITAGVQQPPPLVLNGLELTLTGDIQLDGQPLPRSAYVVSSFNLIILQPPNRTFELNITNKLTLRNQAGLEGLGLSPSGAYITHCEPEGFRRITYYIDRPDVLSKFTVRIQADAEQSPVLLSNGNLKDSGQLCAGQHFAEFEDVIPKPCYLFALVAGQLSVTEASHLSSINGRIIKLRVFTPRPEHLSQVQYAMDSLREAMVWQEAMFNRELYNDVYNMVGTEVFGPAGMENTGVVIFQLSRLALSPDTRTDSEAQDALRLMGHEYFHQWTGNRVTIQDWCNLVTKEGLTQLQEQLFAADVDTAATITAATWLQQPGSSSSSSCENCQISSSSADCFKAHVLQLLQSNSPASPAAAAAGSSWQRVYQHQTLRAPESLTGAVRVDTYTAPKSLYSWSVYDKGAEICRMYHTLLGPEGFAQGMNKYTSKFDTKAAVFEDFHSAMLEANPGVNLTGLLPWLSNETPPTLLVSRSYNSTSGSLTLTVQMREGTGNKDTLLVPVKVGILDADGKDIPFTVRNTDECNATWLSRPYPPLMLPGATATINHKQHDSGISGSSSSNSDADSTSANNPCNTSAWSYSPILLVSQPRQMFRLELGTEVKLGAVSWLRDWSAPVNIGAASPEDVEWLDDLILTAKFDHNPYARWDATHRLASRLMLSLYYAADNTGNADASTLLHALTLPSVTYSNAVAAAAQRAEVRSELEEQRHVLSNSTGRSNDTAIDDAVRIAWCLELRSNASEGCKLLFALKDALQAALSDASFSGQYQGLLLELPTVSQLLTSTKDDKPVQMYKVRAWVANQLANQLIPELTTAVQRADAQLQALLCSSFVSCMPLPTDVVTPNPETDTGPSTEQADLEGLFHGRRRLMVAGKAAHFMRRTVLETDAAENQARVVPVAAVGVFSPPVMSARALRNAAQALLATLNNNNLQVQIEQRFQNLSTLTDRLAAIKALEGASSAYNRTLTDFYAKYGHLPPAIIHWFKVQATSEQPNNSANVGRLMGHPAFNVSDMEHCNALLYSFAESAVNFHAEDGSGYKFMADAVIKVDPANPACATRLVRTLSGWAELAMQQRRHMCGQLVRLNGSELSSSTASAVQRAVTGCQ